MQAISVVDVKSVLAHNKRSADDIGMIPRAVTDTAFHAY